MLTTTLETAAAVIGDVISSRQIVARLDTQLEFEAALERVNQRFDPIQPLRFTIGDEFQGLFVSLAAALRASLWIRLESIDLIGVRMGIGTGEVTVLDPDRSPILQDGSAWWRAREAIGEVSAWESRKGMPQTSHTLVRTEGPDEGAANAGLILADAIVERFDSTDATMTMMALSNGSQEEMSKRLGLHKSSISRRMQSHGIAALVAAYRSFGAEE